MRWEIFPMFGKPTIGNNQQRWDSVALGFEPAIANLFDAFAKPTIAGAPPLCEHTRPLRSGRQNPKGERTNWRPAAARLLPLHHE